MIGPLSPVSALVLVLALAGAQPTDNVDPAQQVTAPASRTPPPPRLEQPLEGSDEPSDLAELGLHRTKDGTYLYVDPSARFTARFHPDGRVDFADRWRRPSEGDRQNGKCCGLPPEGIVGLNPLRGMPMRGPLEWFLQAYGYDLSTGAKSALLERTRELRTRLAVDWHLRQLKLRLRQLDPELLVVWSDASMSIEERRAHLFQRWDECDEYFAVDPSELPPDAILKIDEARMAAAEEARRKIELFVQRHAGVQTRRGYTATELNQMNRRRVSKQRFDPYSVSAPVAASTR